MPIEQIVEEALSSGDHDTGSARITCSAAAQMHITCSGCRNILDETTTQLLEVLKVGDSAEHKDGDVVASFVYCATCMPKYLESAGEKFRIAAWKFQADFYLHTWDGVTKVINHLDCGKQPGDHTEEA